MGLLFVPEMGRTMRRILVAVATALLGLVSIPAEATTCSTSNPYSFDSASIVNGSTASATPVMGDLNYLLYCANTNVATLANPVFSNTVKLGGGVAGNTAKLMVNTPSGTAAGIQLYQDGVESWIMQNLASTTALTFANSGAERLRIDGAGNVGIGTTNPSSSRLVISGTNGPPGASGSGADGVLRVAALASSNGVLDMGVNFGAGYAWLSVTNAADLSTHYALALNPSGGNVGVNTGSPAVALHVVGTIRQTNCTSAIALYADTSGNIICNPSDARLKNILGSYSTGLEALTQVTPKIFTFKATAQSSADPFVHAGFVAQDVMASIPEAVMRQQSGFYALDTTAILAATVNSVKQLKALSDREAAEIVRLKDVNAALAASARALEARVAALERKSRTHMAGN